MQGERSNAFKLAPSPNSSAMKARFESAPDPSYGNGSFEKVTPSSSLPRSIANKGRDNKKPTESDNVGKQTVNGYRRNVRSGHTSGSHGHPDEEEETRRQQPLHFDTRQVLEETPAIFKSLTAGSRGPDTFVYLSSSSSSCKPVPLSQNEEDPCKTFVISSEATAFVNRKNSLNQSSTVNGFGSKINSNNRTDNNEYLSYVIDKGPDEVESRTMSEQNGGQGDDPARDDGGVAESRPKDSDVTPPYSENVDGELDERNGRRSKTEESDTCDRMEANGSDDSGVLSFDKTITGKKEQAFAKLQDELERAHQELRLKDEEVARLTRIREDVERELEELTASLFQVRPVTVDRVRVTLR